MSFFKERVYSFVDDRLQRFSLFGFFAICVISVLNYIEQRNLEWELRIIIYGAGVFLVFFIGHRGTWLTWCIASYVMFNFTQYKNLTCFSILAVLMAFYPKLKYFMLILYGTDACVRYYIQSGGFDILNLCFHFICCAFIYLSTNEFSKRVVKLTEKELDLTNDEKMILDCLSRGIKQNDIVDFSAQTVSRKLRNAKIRNGINNTRKLLEVYIKQNKQQENLL